MEEAYEERRPLAAPPHQGERRAMTTPTQQRKDVEAILTLAHAAEHISAGVKEAKDAYERLQKAGDKAELEYTQAVARFVGAKYPRNHDETYNAPRNGLLTFEQALRIGKGIVQTRDAYGTSPPPPEPEATEEEPERLSEYL